MRALILTLLLSPSAAALQEKVSAFGEYSGYSEERFDGWSTESRYVEMRDGVRLAVDIVRPTRDGELHAEPVPLVWTHSRYHRNVSAMMGRDEIVTWVDINPGLQTLVKHGYAVGAVGVRGSGASFGTFSGLFNEDETKDAAEMCGWFAEQEWCDGNIGMWGGSYLGITQYMAASEHPPSLKAIFPDVAAFDLYDLLYPGGVFREDMMTHWDLLTDQLDAQMLSVPVHGDEGGKLRDEAVAEHADNWQVLDGYRSAPHRDDVVPGLNWSQHGPSPLLERINDSGVAIYHTNGWFDVFALDTCLWFVNYEGPQRVIMGDWSHAQMSMERFRVNAVEHHRWFDRWLKGIENGVEEGPRMHYAVHVEPGEFEWRSTDQWPPLGVVNVEYAFGPEGVMTTGTVEAGQDRYAIDPDATTGSASRWDNAVGVGNMNYSAKELAERAEMALTWTTEPMGRDLTFVGHPVVTLHLEASAGDADLVVVLEELDADGNPRYLTEGVLRASQRKLGEAPYDNLGLPWQRSFEADAAPLPEGQPAEVRMDLHPLAATIQEGHRLRVSLTCADADNLIAPIAGLGESVTVHYGDAHPSGLSLPVEQDVWIVQGEVRTSKGHPVEGAIVRAHTGYGTLRETGRAVTDDEGRYTLTFGPAMRSSDSSLEQVATISARKEGWFEASLGHQGGLMMARPKQGESAREGVVLEGIPFQLDFTLDRGATVEGRLVDVDGVPIPSRKLVIAGEELPPSSNVLDVVRTDPDGRFVFEGVPTGRAWWISLVGVHPTERDKAGTFVFEGEGRHVLGLVFQPDEGTETGDGQRGELFAYEWPHRPKDVYRPRWRAPEGWVERYAGNRFSLIMPPDWVRKPVRGIDSYVAQFEGPDVSLQIDHGIFSSNLESMKDRDNHEQEELHLGLYQATLHRCDGFVGVHLPQAGAIEGVGLTLLAACESDEACDTAEQVLRTLRFPWE